MSARCSSAQGRHQPDAALGGCSHSFLGHQCLEVKGIDMGLRVAEDQEGQECD